MILWHYKGKVYLINENYAILLISTICWSSYFLIKAIRKKQKNSANKKKPVAKTQINQTLKINRGGDGILEKVGNQCLDPGNNYAIDDPKIFKTLFKLYGCKGFKSTIVVTLGAYVAGLLLSCAPFIIENKLFGTVIVRSPRIAMAKAVFVNTLIASVTTLLTAVGAYPSLIVAILIFVLGNSESITRMEKLPNFNSRYDYVNVLETNRNRIVIATEDSKTVLRPIEELSTDKFNIDDFLLGEEVNPTDIIQKNRKNDDFDKSIIKPEKKKRKKIKKVPLSKRTKTLKDLEPIIPHDVYSRTEKFEIKINNKDKENRLGVTTGGKE